MNYESLDMAMVTDMLAPEHGLFQQCLDFQDHS